MTPVASRLIFVAWSDQEGNDPTQVLDGFWGQLFPMYEALINYDQFAQHVPMLAESWSTNSDFTAWTFNLRKGVKFHFGEGEFDAKDVLHVISRLSREEATSAGFWGDVDPEVTNDYEITFHLPNPISGNFTFSNESIFFMYSKDDFDKNGQAGFESRPVATGPYQFKERVSFQHITYDRVPYDHYRVDADFPELRLLNVKEPGTRLAMLLTEEAHIGQVPLRQHELVKSKGLEVVQSSIPATPVYAMFGGNYLASKPAYDPTIPWAAPGEIGLKVRKGLNHAVDRDAIRDSILGGRGENMVVTFWHSSLPGFDQKWVDDFEVNYGYDPALARQLFAEAGYPNGFDLSIAMTPRAELAEALDIAEAIGGYWAAAGVNVTYFPLDIPGFVSAFRNNELRWIWTDATRRFGDPQMLSVVFYGKGPLHFYETPAIDAIYEELELKPTTDRAKRSALLRDAGQMLYDEYSTLPMYWLYLHSVINPKVVAEFITSAYIFPRDLATVKAVMK